MFRTKTSNADIWGFHRGKTEQACEQTIYFLLFEIPPDDHLSHCSVTVLSPVAISAIFCPTAR